MASTLFIFRRAPELVSTALCSPGGHENAASIFISDEGFPTLGGEGVNYENFLRLIMDADKVIVL